MESKGSTILLRIGANVCCHFDDNLGRFCSNETSIGNSFCREHQSFENSINMIHETNIIDIISSTNQLLNQLINNYLINYLINN